MSAYRRPRRSGATIFFTVALAQRGSDLLLRDLDRLRAAVSLTRAAHPFEIDAWVVLPDHMHCIWTLPDGDAAYPSRWSAIKTQFSRALPSQRLGQSQARRREKGIWQRRFWDHHIRDHADFQRHLQYCWYNPVQHGLVRHPTDWDASSLHRDLRNGLAEPDWSKVLMRPHSRAAHSFGEPWAEAVSVA